MKVKDLIAELNQINPELEVFGSVRPANQDGPSYPEMLTGFKLATAYKWGNLTVMDQFYTHHPDGSLTDNKDTQHVIVVMKNSWGL